MSKHQEASDRLLGLDSVDVEVNKNKVTSIYRECEWCSTEKEKIGAWKSRLSCASETGVAYDYITVNFCPYCGQVIKRIEQ